MKKNKANSLIIPSSYISLPSHSIEIDNYANELLEKQNGQLKHKLQKQKNMQNKMKMLQTSYDIWVKGKQEEFTKKVERSQSNRQKAVKKVVEKCKRYDVQVRDKFKEHKRKSKIALRLAWKESQKLKEQMNAYQKFKFSKKRAGSQKSNCSKEDDQDKMAMIKQPNEQEPTVSMVQNNKTSQNEALNEITAQKNKRHHTSIGCNRNHQNNYNKRRVSTLSQFASHKNDVRMGQTLERFYKKKEAEEEKKLQQIVLKLNRIEMLQMKKLKAKKKIVMKPNARKKQIRSFIDNRKEHQHPIVNSEPLKSNCKNWSLHNRQKRNKLQEQQIIKGSTYLHEQQARYIKNILQKQIQLNGIQKKLYLQRLQRQ